MNISKLLTKSAQIFPANLAVAYGSKKFSYAQLNDRVNRIANALYKLGVKQGEKIALLQYNCPEMLESMFASFKIGCCAVPINWRLHPNEFSFIINHSEAKAVIFSPEFCEPLLDLRDRIPKVNYLIALSGAKGEVLDYERQISAESGRFIDADLHPDDLAWLFYTSGTTGHPKGAMLTHRNLLTMTLTYYADYNSLGPDDAILHAAPLSHGSGLYALPNIAQGAANVILESKSFDPELVFYTVQEYKVTNMFAAPTMVNILATSPAVGKYDFRTMKILIYGGGPMHVENLVVAMKQLGPCLTQLYGMGESPMTISYLPNRDHVLEGNELQMKRLASAGFARTGVEVRVVDNNDHQVSTGEMGEIVTRSDVVMKGYWLNPEASSEILKNGWLHTGDMGYMDEKGYLFIMDRSKDMIISGGENIYPREIEEVLIQHPAIREVAVISVPDPKWGEAIKAVVSLNKDQFITEDELISFCKDHIASYKKPQSVDFVSELPKNNYGKILKRELRTKYWEGKERKVG